MSVREGLSVSVVEGAVSVSVRGCQCQSEGLSVSVRGAVSVSVRGCQCQSEGLSVSV